MSYTVVHAPRPAHTCDLPSAEKFRLFDRVKCDDCGRVWVCEVEGMVFGGVHWRRSFGTFLRDAFGRKP